MLTPAFRSSITNCDGIRCVRESQADIGDDETRDCSGKREQHAFGDELPRNPPSRRAKCESDRQFAVPCRRSREHQVRQVGARDQQDECDGAEQDVGRGPDVLKQRRRPRRCGQAPALIFLELRDVRLLHLRRDRGQLRIRGCQRRARSQPADDRELPDVPGHSRKVAAPGDPQVRADQHESWRHDTDNGG